MLHFIKTISAKRLQKNQVQILVFIFLIILGFFACKRSIFKNNNPTYDEKLVDTLKKLEVKYADKKVRINTWDKKANAYQDIQVLDEDDQKIATLTIGDSVKFIAIDSSRPDGIRAEIKLGNNSSGYIPYWEVEEFEPAARIDSDLNE